MRLLRISEPIRSARLHLRAQAGSFRALAHVRGHRCQIVSRNGYTFDQWPQFAEQME